MSREHRVYFDINTNYFTTKAQTKFTISQYTGVVEILVGKNSHASKRNGITDLDSLKLKYIFPQLNQIHFCVSTQNHYISVFC